MEGGGVWDEGVVVVDEEYDEYVLGDSLLLEIDEMIVFWRRGDFRDVYRNLGRVYFDWEFVDDVING